MGVVSAAPKLCIEQTKAGQQGELLCTTVKCARECTCALMFEYSVWVAVGFMHYEWSKSFACHPELANQQ